MRKLSILLLAFFCFSFIYAETTVLKGKAANDKVPNSEIVRFKSFTTIPNYVKFKKGKELPLVKLESWIAQYYTSNTKFGLKLLKKETGSLGFTHYRYQQTINGIPVKLGVYIAHVKNGLVYAVNGELYNNINVNVTVSLTESIALNKALDYISADTYKWELLSEENHLKWEQEDENATYFPKGELVLINSKANINNSLVLAYRFNIYAQKPLSRKEVYVNAQTGEIVWVEDKIHEADVVGTATTLYSGTQTITSDNSSGPFRLQETGRGNGIRTFTNNNTTTYSNTDITNTSATWTMSEAGLDAHWGAEMTYDYYLTQHGRNSIDGNGFRLDSYVHHDNNYSNAFWDGQRMTYGDGSGNNTPFTAIDIAGHEITHGLTSNTANLVYNAESGALNESFSDIFGISIDFINRPGVADWELGDDLGFIIRDMADPNSENDPHTYFGNFWASLTGGDNGGVHTNSGVQNFWFVLLTDGGSGTNDNGDSYTINQLGLTIAGQVAFRNLTVYLTPSSQYADARFYAIQSTVDLFGGCTPEVEAVTNAWYAVGVGAAYVPVTVSDFDAPTLTSCSAPFTANFNNLSVNGNTFTWDFGDGNNSSLNNPSNTYASYGTYTVELIADGGTCGIDTTVKVAYIVVDSNLACITILPTTGTVSTQTSCVGTIYDSGGSSGNYGANEDAQITISPTGASTVDLTFVTFDVEAGQSGSCNFDYVEVYDGPNTSSTLIDTYCNNNIPTTVSSTGGSITIVFHSDGGVEDAGFQIDWQCQMPSQAPVVDFSVDVDTTCLGLVNFTDLSNNGPTSWFWDFGDGNTSLQQNPSHTYLVNGLYTVELTSTNAIGSNNLIKTNYIYVNMPTAPLVTDDNICINDTANLSATGLGTLNWYNVPIAGSIINTGGAYVTPPLTTTTTYYVEDVIASPNLSMGKTTNAGGGANFNNYQYLFFDVYQQMEIISVVVYSGASGNRTIELRDNVGTVLQTTTVNIPNGTSTVTLNFNVAPGTNYQLGVSSTSAIDMYRNNAGVTYPYTLSGIASITRSSASQNGGLDHYYFFYDWKVKEPDCVSPRTAVTATVNALPTVVANATSTSICSGDPVTLTGSGASTYNWDNGVTDGLAFVPTITTTYTVTGNDGTCTNTDQITITVNICTGVNENTNSNLSVYPNPANEILVIEGVLNNTAIINKQFKIVDVLGKIVLADVITNNKQTINITSIAKGAYFVVLDDGNIVLKLLKQ
jgi:Zn-dependent metalloprotease